MFRWIAAVPSTFTSFELSTTVDIQDVFDQVELWRVTRLLLMIPEQMYLLCCDLGTTSRVATLLDVGTVCSVIQKTSYLCHGGGSTLSYRKRGSSCLGSLGGPSPSLDGSGRVYVGTLSTIERRIVLN